MKCSTPSGLRRSAMIGSAPRQRAIAVAAWPTMPAPPVIRIVSPGMSSMMLMTVCQAAKYDRPTAAASAIVRRSGLRDSHVSGRATKRACVPGRVSDSQRRPAAPHLLAGVVAVGDDDAGEVDAGNHRQRRAEQARGVGDVERVHRRSVHLDEHLPRTRLRHRFGTIGQRLRWRPAGLDDDCVHLLLFVAVRVLGAGGHVQFLALSFT